MGARGRIPQVQQQIDELVFGAQASAECQVDNTFGMLESLARIFADGLVDDKDEREVRRLLHLTKAEHKLNAVQVQDMTRIRKLINPVFALIAKARTENQRLRASK